MRIVSFAFIKREDCNAREKNVMAGIRFFVFTVAVAAAHASTAMAQPPSEPPRTRAEFASAMNKVKEEMPQAEVLALLGKPHDFKTEEDPGGISTVGTKEIWRYGTSGHLTTATLGQVYIDTKGKVQYVYGKGKPQTDKLPEERVLRQILEVLGQVPSY